MEKVKNDSKLIIGIILIVFGILLMFETTGLINLSIKYYIFSWKTLLIFIGIVLFFNKKRKISGLVLISLGVAFWFPSIFGLNVRFHQVFLPLALISIGALIVSKRGGVKNLEGKKINVDGEYIFEGNIINDFSIFGGSRKNIDSESFKGGTLTAVFGSNELNLLNADLDKDGGVIDVFTLFGGTTLFVPNDWKVQSDVLSILGSFNDKRRIEMSEINSDKVLFIKGIVIFGGIEIRNY